MLPWFSAQAGSRERIAQGFELGTKATAAVLVPVGLTFILFAEPLIELLYGSGYGPAVTPLRFLGVGVVFLGINNLAASLMIARDRPLAFAAVGAAALVGNVALNVVLIPEYGADGAAFTAALSAFGVFIAGFFLIRSLAGRVRLVRSLAAPFAAGGVASLIVLFAGLPVIPAALAGGVAYALVFVSFEHLAFPDDLRTFRRLADRRGDVPAETAEAVEVMREREGS
jgi:O-antigen/teichoic acid export membrane protein